MSPNDPPATSVVKPLEKAVFWGVVDWVHLHYRIMVSIGGAHDHGRTTMHPSAHTLRHHHTPSYPTIFNNIRSVHLSLSTLTVGSPSHELQLHHMWLLTLFVHGARSLQFLLFEPTTTFFLIPKMRAQSQC